MKGKMASTVRSELSAEICQPQADITLFYFSPTS